MRKYRKGWIQHLIQVEKKTPQQIQYLNVQDLLCKSGSSLDVKDEAVRDAMT